MSEMKKEALSSAFSGKILEEGKKDQDIVVVCTDSRGSGKLGAFPAELPEQFVEMGIAEQNSVTVSAGLSHTGKKVFCMGPASFYSMRSAEQVKVDVAYSHNPVTIIGISGGVSYGALGATHHSLQDIALMRSIPGITVEIPSDAVQMVKITEELLKNPRPAYIRIPRGAVPVIYKEDAEIEIGKANVWFDGADAAIVSCGQLTYYAIEAAKLLEKEGIRIRVVDIHSVKPIDEKAVLEAAEQCGCILTLEEHSIYGGLGGAVSEIVSERYPVPMIIAGIPDEDVPNGSDLQVFTYYHLDTAGIADKIRTLMKRKS